MEKLIIRGGIPLKGEVEISGAKNAAVAILPATLLSDGVCRIENVPNIANVIIILRILQELGANVKTINKSTYEIDCRGVHTHVVPYSLTRHARGASYFMGAMLGRYNRALVGPPGGCNFGVRPIDLHTRGFKLLGAEVKTENGMIDLKADKLCGNNIYMDNPSVGATVNIMLAAVRAEGLTVIENAAKEPHIVDLANFLSSIGADIRGAGTDIIKIRGVKTLGGGTYSIIPDQIEAGTYMVAAAATGGDVYVKNVIPKHLESITAKLEDAGVKIEEFDDCIHVWRDGPLTKCNVKTLPHPGFPTDMQPQMLTMLTIAQGTSMVTESIFDNRFKYTEYLSRMGAQINIPDGGKTAVVEGVDHLEAAPIKAIDLRAGAAMIIAALMAHGDSEVEEIQHIERGYEDFIGKFRQLGANITKVYDDPIEQAIVG